MIDYSFVSNPGSYSVNEDSVSILDLPDRKVFVLADGLGGHGLGEIASQHAVKSAYDFMSNQTYVSCDTLRLCIANIHNKIIDMQSIDHKINSMKTTVVILVIDNGRAFWAHVGDSRLYSFSRFRIIQQTLDHSVPQMMVNIGEIKKKDIRTSSDRNRLVQAVGMRNAELRIDVVPAPVNIKKGQGFLLCSDGFWEFIDEQHMKNCFRQSSGAAEWVNRMTQIVYNNGTFSDKKMDNYTAITVMIK